MKSEKVGSRKMQETRKSKKSEKVGNQKKQENRKKEVRKNQRINTNLNQDQRGHSLDLWFCFTVMSNNNWFIYSISFTQSLTTIKIKPGKNHPRVRYQWGNLVNLFLFN